MQLTCAPGTRTSPLVPGVSPEPPKVGRISVVLEERGESGTSSKEQILVQMKERLAGCEKEQMENSSQTSIILVLNGHGHGMFMDTGLMFHVLLFPPTGDKGLPMTPKEKGAIPALTLSRDIHPNSRNPRKRPWKPRPHRLTISLKKAVVARQPLQEFRWGCQRTLGFEAEVHHTCRRTGGPKPQGWKGAWWQLHRRLTNEGKTSQFH